MPLYGMYGHHTLDDCPLKNKEAAKIVVSIAEDDRSALLRECKINKILGQYHSAFEHTFVWILDAEDAHLIEQFAWESGIALHNTIKIVPLKTLTDNVAPKAKQIHNL
ncbi:MAG: hypothetical protein ACYTF7_03535 [Planctomycetota bacterium]|jgi:hypothetical protein